MVFVIYSSRSIPSTAVIVGDRFIFLWAKWSSAFKYFRVFLDNSGKFETILMIVEGNERLRTCRMKRLKEVSDIVSGCLLCSISWFFWDLLDHCTQYSYTFWWPWKLFQDVCCLRAYLKWCCPQLKSSGLHVASLTPRQQTLWLISVQDFSNVM